MHRCAVAAASLESGNGRLSDVAAKSCSGPTDRTIFRPRVFPLRKYDREKLNKIQREKNEGREGRAENVAFSTRFFLFLSFSFSSFFFFLFRSLNFGTRFHRIALEAVFLRLSLTTTGGKGKGRATRIGLSARGGNKSSRGHRLSVYRLYREVLREIGSLIRFSAKSTYMHRYIPPLNVGQFFRLIFFGGASRIVGCLPSAVAFISFIARRITVDLSVKRNVELNTCMHVYKYQL